jgi:type VI secretion system protein ImpM
MRCGLYGKLPAKRDFIAVGAPRAFLDVLEPWLQGGLSASQLALGDAWRDAFLRAPIWRFWLGAEVCGGLTVAGAFMPSVDGVGRYFPLAAFAASDAPGAIPPPELDPQDSWFAEVEDFLLFTLQEGTSFEAVTERLSRLGHPEPAPSRPATGGSIRLRDGTLLAAFLPASFRDRLAGLRTEDQSRVYATASFWWTVGGEGFPPLVLLGQRMPSPYLFSTLLTGEFEGADR